MSAQRGAGLTARERSIALAKGGHAHRRGIGGHPPEGPHIAGRDGQDGGAVWPQIPGAGRPRVGALARGAGGGWHGVALQAYAGRDIEVAADHAFGDPDLCAFRNERVVSRHSRRGHAT